MSNRTVLHGVDSSGPDHTVKPGYGNPGQLFWEEDNFSLMAYDDAVNGAGKGWIPACGMIGFAYDFAVDGGAVGALEIATIPDNFVIVEGIYDVTTAITSQGSATVAFGCNTATDLLAATAIGTMGTAAVHALIPVGTAATAVKATAARTLTMTIAVEDLDTGKLRGYLRGFMSD